MTACIATTTAVSWVKRTSTLIDSKPQQNIIIYYFHVTYKTNNRRCNPSEPFLVN